MEKLEKLLITNMITFYKNYKGENKMLDEYHDVITHMKEVGGQSALISRIFDKHSELDEQINQAESIKHILTEMEIDIMKKEKLKLKDEAYAIIINYKKKHNL